MVVPCAVVEGVRNSQKKKMNRREMKEVVRWCSREI